MLGLLRGYRLVEVADVTCHFFTPGWFATDYQSCDIASLISTSATEGLPGLPRLLDRVSRGAYEALEPALRNRLEGTSQALGMRLCVWCREELPFARPAVIRRETSRYPGLRGRSPAVFAPAVCGAWAGPAKPKTGP